MHTLYTHAYPVYTPQVFAYIDEHTTPLSSGVCLRVSAQAPQSHVRAHPSAPHGFGGGKAHTQEPGFAPENDNQLLAESVPLTNLGKNIVFEFLKLSLPFT